MLITFGIHLYEICTKNVFLICLVHIFKTGAIKKKKSLWFQSIPLAICFHTIVKKKFVFLKFNAKTISPPPSIFKSREGNCPQLFRPWSGISEVRTTDSYGASEFMSVRIFSCLSVSVFWVFVIFCQPLNICLFVMLYLYIYIIYICIVIKVIYWPFKFKTI